MSLLTSRTRTPTVGGGPFLDGVGFDSTGFDSAVFDSAALARISVIRRPSCGRPSYGVAHTASLKLRRLDNQGLGDFHLAVLEGVDECVDHGGIEVCSGAGDDDLPGFEWGDGAAIGAIAGESVKGIGDGQDSGFNRNLFAFRRTVTRTIELVVMGKNDGKDAAQRSANRLEQGDSLLDVLAHFRHFFRG